MTPRALPASILVVGAGRDRRRVRELLPQPRQRGDARRGGRPGPAQRGPRDLRARAEGLRAPRHARAHRDRGGVAALRRRWRRGALRGPEGASEVARRARDQRRRHRGQRRGPRPGGHRRRSSTADTSSSARGSRPASLASTRSATSRHRRGSRTRRATRRRSASRRSPGSRTWSPLDANRIPACTYSHPQIASIGLTEHRRAARGARGADRHLPVRRQRQGDRDAAGRRHGQDGVRRDDRRTPRRAHDRVGRDRTDPGLSPSPCRRRRPRPSSRTRSSRIRRCPKRCTNRCCTLWAARCITERRKQEQRMDNLDDVTATAPDGATRPPPRRSGRSSRACAAAATAAAA